MLRVHRGGLIFQGESKFNSCSLLNTDPRSVFWGYVTDRKKTRSRCLDSLTACKFSSRSSEHRQRSYAFSPRSCRHAKSSRDSIVPWISYALLWHDAAPAGRPAIALRGLLCTPFSKRRARTLRKWLYSLGCPQALAGKGPTRTIASRAWAAVTPSPRDAGRRLLIRSRLSFWVHHSFNFCLTP